MNRQRITLIVMIALFVLMGGVLYFGFFARPATPSPMSAAENISGPLPAFPFDQADIASAQDIEALKGGRLQAFITLPGLPITVPAGGRSSPFAPLQ